ncbi:MAG TPA: alpha-glucosidase, partial [Longilinea sp.]|nr:alpha-glucosidase [Longilinea sp.]
LGLKGTPVLYNGEEIGMSDYLFSDPKQFRDSLALRYFELDKRVMGSAPEQAALVGAHEGRDKCRTPHQWSNTPQAGFCLPPVTPWLPVNPNFSAGINVADQEKDKHSLLSYYRRIMNARQSNKALLQGDYQDIPSQDVNALIFSRSIDDQCVICVQNMSDKICSVQLDQTKTGDVLFSSIERKGNVNLSEKIVMQPYEILWISV